MTAAASRRSHARRCRIRLVAATAVSATVQLTNAKRFSILLHSQIR
jgi:hypothetical protein